MTIQTAVLIETLAALRCKKLPISFILKYCFQHKIKFAAIAEAGIPVYARKGMNEEEFDWCIEQTLFFFEDRKPLNMILDDVLI